MKKFLASTLLVCITYVSAADLEEIARLPLHLDGRESLICVVSMDDSANVKIHINSTEVAVNEDLIRAIQDGTLTFEEALELIEEALNSEETPSLTKTKTYRALTKNPSKARTEQHQNLGSSSSESEKDEPEIL